MVLGCKACGKTLTTDRGGHHFGQCIFERLFCHSCTRDWSLYIYIFIYVHIMCYVYIYFFCWGIPGFVYSSLPYLQSYCMVSSLSNMLSNVLKHHVYSRIRHWSYCLNFHYCSLFGSLWEKHSDLVSPRALRLSRKQAPQVAYLSQFSHPCLQSIQPPSR